MPKFGQARVPSSDQQRTMFDEIRKRRHPEKNEAIMQISFKLGLRVQEIALLEIKEVAQLLSGGCDFRLHEIMTLPAIYTKGSGATRRSVSNYQRRSLTFSADKFDQVIQDVVKIVESGGTVDPKAFYPEVKERKGKSRDLPLINEELRNALIAHLRVRLAKAGALKPSDPLFVTQKGGPYSPNTLQEHMSMMLREWAGIEKASSHSGRRTVITNLIHQQGYPVKVAQKIAGHVNPSTTIIYEEPPADLISQALYGVGKESK